MAISTSAPRSASPLPRLEAGDHLDQATFVFPGLWLHQTALLQLEGAQVMETLRQGVDSPEHAVFVQQLQARRETSS